MIFVVRSLATVFTFFEKLVRMLRMSLQGCCDAYLMELWDFLMMYLFWEGGIKRGGIVFWVPARQAVLLISFLLYLFLWSVLLLVFSSLFFCFVRYCFFDVLYFVVK
jgi:hypothetical protein